MKEKKNIFADRNVLVVGLARSGIGAANLLSAFGAKVTVTDSKPRESLEERVRKLDGPVRVVAGDNPLDLFESSDLIVVSPGVPLDIRPLVHARSRGVHIIGELELAYQVIKAGVRGQGSGVRGSMKGSRVKRQGAGKTGPEFIGITGTNGKSTVTTLVDLMLRKSGRRTLLGGNIGNALTGELLKTGVRGQKQGVRVKGQGTRGSGTEDIDFIVAEISSFQLESIELFRPHIAAVLNITPDHLDRYRSMNDYIDAKSRIFENQMPEDCLVLNADDPVVTELAGERLSPENARSPKTFFFSRKKEVKGVYYRDGALYCNIPNLAFPSSRFPFISLEEIRIRGAHNLENAMSASLIALLSGQPYGPVRDALKKFSGLEHRLEFVREIHGIQFINDSKATNIGAVEKSLEGLDHVVLIMGGMDKGGDFSALRDLVKEKVKCLVVIGAAQEAIERAFAGHTEICRAADLKEALALSVLKASPGDTVLLSPGCASFDMFKDFEERGKRFKEIVKGVRAQ